MQDIREAISKDKVICFSQISIYALYCSILNFVNASILR